MRRQVKRELKSRWAHERESREELEGGLHFTAASRRPRKYYIWKGLPLRRDVREGSRRYPCSEGSVGYLEDSLNGNPSEEVPLAHREIWIVICDQHSRRRTRLYVQLWLQVKQLLTVSEREARGRKKECSAQDERSPTVTALPQPIDREILYLIVLFICLSIRSVC